MRRTRSPVQLDFESRRIVGRREPVVRAKQGIEPPDALETAGEGDLDDGQVRLGEQLLGQQQPLRLGQLDRGDAELLLDGAPELPGAQTEVAGQFVQASAVIQGTRLDPARSGLGCSPDRVDRSMARRQLGPAAQAGPEPVSFGQGPVRDRNGSDRVPGQRAVQIGRQ